MAKEIKSIDVSNSQEETYINIYQSFGWELKSSQRVFNRDSRLKSEGDSLYTETTTTDFTKLVFEREKKIQNYDKLTALETEFWRLSKVEGPSEDPSVGLRLWTILEEPELRTKGEKILRTVIFVLIMVLEMAIFLFGQFIFPKEVNAKIFEYLNPLTIVITFIVGKFILKEAAFESIARTIGIYIPGSKCRKRLDMLYHQAELEVQQYEKSREKMSEILEEAGKLL